MNRRYQIDRERALRRFAALAEEEDREIQLHLPLKEIAAGLQASVSELIRQTGLPLTQSIMEEEVRQLAAECCHGRHGEQGYRWGRESGFFVVDGPQDQDRTAAGAVGDRPRTAAWQLRAVPRGEPLDQAVCDKLLLGLSTQL